MTLRSASPTGFHEGMGPNGDRQTAAPKEHLMRILDSLTLKFGAGPSDGPLTIDAASPIVVIGPNNSGKSTLLREVYGFLTDNGFRADSTVILEKCDIPLLDAGQAAFLIDEHYVGNLEHSPDPDQIYIGWPSDQGSGTAVRKTVQRSVAIRSMSDADGWERRNRNHTNVLSLLVKRLDGSNRVNLVDNVDYGDVRNRKAGPSQFAMKNAFDNPDIHLRLSSLIHDATGRYLGLSGATPAGKISAFLTQDDIAKGELFDARSFHDEVCDYYSDEMKAQPISSQSDGTKAFSGLALELLAGAESTLLIDEPEAFLHPTLSRMLGSAIGREATNKQIIVSTHSADFLLGCLESGSGVNVVRLTHDGDVSTAHLLNQHDIRKMIYDPLLRSENVVSGLFHSAVVVVEGDSDQAFYQEVNYRIGSVEGDSPIRGGLFVNGRGDSSEKKIVGLMRNAGIPAACIVDFDFLAKNGEDFGGLLSSSNLPKEMIASLKSRRGQVCADVRQCKERREGLDGLGSGKREVAQSMIRDMEEYGVFVVPVGEVENWLASLGVSNDKKGWIKRIFTKMGSDPEGNDYVKPSSDDVWDFIRRISEWVKDPCRKGMEYSG